MKNLRFYLRICVRVEFRVVCILDGLRCLSQQASLAFVIWLSLVAPLLSSLYPISFPDNTAIIVVYKLVLSSPLAPPLRLGLLPPCIPILSPFVIPAFVSLVLIIPFPIHLGSQLISAFLGRDNDRRLTRAFSHNSPRRKGSDEQCSISGECR